MVVKVVVARVSAVRVVVVKVAAETRLSATGVTPVCQPWLFCLLNW